MCCSGRRWIDTRSERRRWHDGSLAGLGGTCFKTYRLVTNILNPAQAPALELARLYSERWTVETAFNEIKTHLRGSHIVLRSKLPELVRQDVYGLLLAHFGVRFVMHDAAVSEDICTEELSFVHTLRVVHRKLPWFISFPPPERSYVSEVMRSETLEERVRCRPRRHCPRGVKRKMSNWNVVDRQKRHTESRTDSKPPQTRST